MPSSLALSDVLGSVENRIGKSTGSMLRRPWVGIVRRGCFKPKPCETFYGPHGFAKIFLIEAFEHAWPCRQGNSGIIIRRPSFGLLASTGR